MNSCSAVTAGVVKNVAETPMAIELPAKTGLPALIVDLRSSLSH